jgi:hypothetical protein
LVVDDFDGDGRQDILKWGQTSDENGIYLSNGNGSFRERVPAGLNAIARPLQSVDGSTSFVLGDFLGTGAVQILHMKDDPAGANPTFDPAYKKNQLYERLVGGPPVDVLTSITSPTGLVSRVVRREPLPNSARYQSERVAGAGTGGAIVDLQPPMYVITTTSQETDVGASLNTEYLYKGLKADRGGRGLQGFREVRQQSPAPDGINFITSVTEFQQIYPYTGVAATSSTYLSTSSPGTLLNPGGASLLSRTINSFCDKTAAAGPSDIPAPPYVVVPAPCAVAATTKIQRPYLYQTREQSWDWNQTTSTLKELPYITTTNSYNNSGDPLTIKVVTNGTALNGLGQIFTKTTTNVFNPEDTAGDKWILGRLQKASVLNMVPNSLDGIGVSAGNSPYAEAQNGSGAVTSSGPVMDMPKRPDPMVVGQIYKVGWSSKNANRVTWNCTSTSTGFIGSGEANPPGDGSVEGTALAGWVGFPSRCEWTAYDDATGRSDKKVEILNTVPAPKIIEIKRDPPTMISAQPFTVKWKAINTRTVDPLSYNCTTTGTGYDSKGEQFVSNPDSSNGGTALSAWVGFPSNCVWTAYGPSGLKATLTETLITTPGPEVVKIQREPPTMVAGQRFDVTWITINTRAENPLSYDCTSATGGYTSNGKQFIANANSSVGGNASADWVDRPSTCIWTAYGANGLEHTRTEILNTVAAAGSGPTLEVTRVPRPMVAGQAYTVTWNAPGAISLLFGCTGTGYSTGGNENMYPASGGSRPMTAYWGQVGNPGTCTWTATYANGASKTVTEQLTTVAP